MGFEQDCHDLMANTDPTLDIGLAVGGPDGEVWTDGRELLFQACSISKHVAAFGTLRLVAEGTLDLDADVNASLSSWQLPGSGTVTVRQPDLGGPSPFSLQASSQSPSSDNASA